MGVRYTAASSHGETIQRSAGRVDPAGVSDGEPLERALREVEEACPHAYTFSDEVLTTLFGKTGDQLGTTPTHLVSCRAGWRAQRRAVQVCSVPAAPTILSRCARRLMCGVCLPVRLTH